MEELKNDWHGSTKKINDALEFLDDYFGNEHADDKTAGQAYKILKMCAVALIKMGDLLTDDVK